MQAEFDHMTNEALQMHVICTENRDSLTWDAQQALTRAKAALRGRRDALVVPYGALQVAA